MSEDAPQDAGVRPDEPLPPAPLEECPPGWVTGPPHFVGVGAQRCGTTWWHRQIALHPGVAFRQGLHHKEVHFFDTLEGARLDAADVERYGRYFARPPEGAVTGEWTPRYMYDGWPLAQIATAAPDARILVMLRDPVDRYASGYAREDRLARRRSEEGISPAMVEEQRARGFFARDVERVLDTFSRQRVLILQYERCRAEYDRELARTYEFLGLDPDFRPAGWRNAPGEPRAREMPAALRAELAREYAPDVVRLARIAPAIDPALWPNVRDFL